MFANAKRSRKRPAIGCIRVEWKAWEVWRRRQTCPAAASCPSNAAIAASGPASTESAGPATAASESPPASQGAMPSGPAGTASIAPGGSSSISRALPATRRRASSSDSTPARQAATYSPRLKPSIAWGTIPQSMRRQASACSTTKTAGWERAVRRSRPAASVSPDRPSRPRRSIPGAVLSSSSPSGYSSCRRSRPRSGRRRDALSSIRSRNPASSR